MTAIILNTNRTKALKRPINPNANSMGKPNSIPAASVAAISGDNRGTEYSFSNKYKVLSHVPILVRPDLKNTLATHKRMARLLNGAR